MSTSRNFESISNPAKPFSETDNLIFTELKKALKGQDLDTAERLIYSLVLNNPKNPVYSVKLAHLMYKKTQYSKAESFYLYALNCENSENFTSEIFFGLGQSLFKMKKYSESLNFFNELTTKDPNYHLIEIVHLKLAWIWIYFQNYDTSLKFLIEILKKKQKTSENFAITLCTIAKVFGIQRKHEHQEYFFEKAYKYNKNFRSVAGIASFYLSRLPKKSEKICERFLLKNSAKAEWCDIKFLQALALAKQNRLGMAEEILLDILKKYPNNILYLQYLGIVYFNQGRLTDAIEKFQIVSNFDGENETNFNNLNVCYKKIGMKIEAWRCFKDANFGDGDLKKMRKMRIREPEYDVLEFPTNCHTI